MEPRISIFTLGVSDLGRSTRFYRDGLGFPEHEAGGDEITFIALTGLLLGLYPRDALADDIGRPDQKGTPQPALHGFTIAHNVATRAEVDSVLRQAATAGASIVKPAAETFWGGYLRVLRRSRRLPVGSGDRLRPAHRTRGGWLIPDENAGSCSSL